MDKTLFAGLTRLDPGEPISTDNSSFTRDNPSIVDHFLEIGARTHRHDAAPALANPIAAPVGLVTPSGGAIPADSAIYFGYTLLDEHNGETTLSATTMLATDPGIPRPESELTATIDYSTGSLLVDTFYYAITWTDDAGGETGLGPIVAVDRNPGYPNASVTLTELTAGMADFDGVTGWRLYRATGGSEFGLLTYGDASTDAYTDLGANTVDCTQMPPPDNQNTTGATNKIALTIPAVLAPGAVSLRLYASVDGSFTDGGILDTFALPAEAGATREYTVIQVVDGRPPITATTVAGALQIDPDTELLDWHWKRPVAAVGDLPATGNTTGDVRIVTGSAQLYLWDGDSWTPVLGAGSGHVVMDEGVAQTTRANLDFAGAGVTVSDDPADNKTIVTIPGGGAGGAAGDPVYEEGTRVRWETAAGQPIAAIYADQAWQNAGATVTDDFTGAAAGAWQGQFDYGTDGTTYLIPDASGNGLDVMAQLNSVFSVGLYVERTIEFLTAGWHRSGIQIGAAMIGVFGFIDKDAGQLQIRVKKHSDGQGSTGSNPIDEPNYAVVASVAAVVPAAPWTCLMMLQRRGRAVTFACFDTTGGGFTQLGVDLYHTLTDAEYPEFGSGTWDNEQMYAGPADWWTAAGAWRSDSLAVTPQRLVRSLHFATLNPDGSDETTVLALDSDGNRTPPPAPTRFALTAGNSTVAAGWTADAATEYWTDFDGVVHLRGRFVKNVGVAPAAGESIVTLNAGAADPRFQPQVTGDSDGIQLGIVKLDGPLVTWEAGTSSNPSVKHPFVDLDLDF